jgi:hypothetical protein
MQMQQQMAILVAQFHRRNFSYRAKLANEQDTPNLTTSGGKGGCTKQATIFHAHSQIGVHCRSRMHEQTNRSGSEEREGDLSHGRGGGGGEDAGLILLLLQRLLHQEGLLLLLLLLPEPQLLLLLLLAPAGAIHLLRLRLDRIPGRPRARSNRLMDQRIGSNRSKDLVAKFLRGIEQGNGGRGGEIFPPIFSLSLSPLFSPSVFSSSGSNGD